MNGLSIDLYLSKGKIETLYLNDCILNENFGVAELKDKTYGMIGLFNIISNLKTKKQILTFLRRNSNQLRKISSIMLTGFDPFNQKGPSIPPPQEQTKPESTYKEPETTYYEPEPTHKEEKISKSKMKEAYEKIKQMLISFLRKLKEKFSNFNITVDQVIKTFESIYYIIVKGIEVTTLTILTYYFGYGIIAIFALIYMFIILMNMIYIKVNNEEMTFNEAFLKSGQELVIVIKKFLTQLKVEKEEGYIAFLTFFLGIVIYKLKMLGIKGLFSSDISILGNTWFYLIIVAILVGSILYFILKLFDRLPRNADIS